MSDTVSNKVCVACATDSETTPLIPLEYRGETFWICPRHLPILIHKPSSLAGILPGVERLQPAEGHPH